MNKNETEIMSSLFHSYYEKAEGLYVNELSKREIGYIPFNGTMIRHQKVDPGNAGNGMRIFAMKTVPRHLYNSVAFYRKPDERLMKEKDWLGAEVIFDLDADHIEGSSEMSYENTLVEVRKHTERLIHRYLTGILGLSEDSLSLYFSGGRGYHVHILKEELFDMNSDQRREISNLVRGEGLKSKEFCEVAKNGIFSGRGWINDIDDAFSQAMEKAIFGNAEKDALLLRIQKHYEKKSDMKAEERKKKKTIPGPEKYVTLLKDELELLDRIINSMREELSCEVDEPVTTDVHRLIRFTNSLHGKTGLQVKRVKIEELHSFEPLNEAIPEIFLEGEMKVSSKTPFTIRMLKNNFTVDKETVVPKYVGIYSVLSGKGVLE